MGEEYPDGRYGREAGKYLTELKALEAKERSTAATHPATTTRPAATLPNR